MSKESTSTPEEQGKRIGNLLLFILAGADVIRTEVLDRVDIDRHAVSDMADNIEKHAYELAHLVLGANIDEWKAEQARKGDRAKG